VQSFSPAAFRWLESLSGRPKGLHYLWVVCLLAVAAPASAAPWHRIDTPNFIVVGDVSARELRATATKFEGFHEALRRVLPSATMRSPVPTVVIVFPNDGAFVPFKPQYQGKPKPVAGYAAPGLDLSYIAMISAGEVSDRVIFHEYTHMILANAIAGVPLWLNEGLAEFYSTFALMDDGKRAQIGRPIAEHLQLLSGSLRVPLGDLLKVHSASPLYNEASRLGDFYAESWALTHMLLNGQPSRVNELADYLRRLGDGASEMQAWEQVFGTARTDGELRQYLRRTTFTTVVIDFAEKVAAVPITESALSAADAAGFLAQLQLRNLGPDAAAKILEPALTQEPASATANVAMARIDLARHDPARAATRVLALGPGNDWFTTYAAGVTLAEAVEADRSMGGPGGAALVSAAQLLERVRRTHADLPNVLARLAAIEILAEASPPSNAAHEYVARARALAPGRIDYALTQAELFANARDFAAARRVIGPLMTPVYPEDVRNAARRLMGGLVDLERAISGGGGPARSTEAVPTSGGSPAPAERSRSVGVPDADEGKPRDTAGQGRFVPAFRAVQAGEQRIDGVLERIDCPPDAPARFMVRNGSGLTALPVARMADVDFISYRGDLTGGVSCGPSREPMRVYVTVREGPAPARQKTVVAVEFLPKN